MEILLGVLFFFILVAYALSKTKVDVHLDSDNKTITSQDDLEDVVKEEIIEATIITTDDFVEKPVEEFKETVNGRQLTEHIAEVIELHPDSKKHLNKRQRKTVDKIVKEKK